MHPVLVRPPATCVCTYSSLLFPVESGPALMDLSKATKLRDVVFRFESWNVEWVTVALQTITPKHRDFREISISAACYQTTFNIDANVREMIGKTSCGHWSDLDHLLVQFWESRSIRPRLMCLSM